MTELRTWTGERGGEERWPAPCARSRHRSPNPLRRPAPEPGPPARTRRRAVAEEPLLPAARSRGPVDRRRGSRRDRRTRAWSTRSVLAAVGAMRRGGLLDAALDAVRARPDDRPGDPDLHLALAELYLDRGWRDGAADKLVPPRPARRAVRRRGPARERLRALRATPASRMTPRLSSAASLTLHSGHDVAGSSSRSSTRSAPRRSSTSGSPRSSSTGCSPDPRDPGRPSRHRRQRPLRGLRGRPALRPAAPAPDPPDRRRRRPVRPRRRLPARAPAGARADRPGRLVRPGCSRRSSDRSAEHVAAEVAHAAGVLAAQVYGALIVLERETGLEEIAETGVMLHARAVGRPAAHDLHAPDRPPRRRGHRPRRADRGGRRAPARWPRRRSRPSARDAPPGRPRDHRADRRRRRRGQRGERPDQPRRARADRAQSEREPAERALAGLLRPGRAAARSSGAAAARSARSRWPGRRAARWPASGARSGARRPTAAPGRPGRRSSGAEVETTAAASSAASVAAKPPAGEPGPNPGPTADDPPTAPRSRSDRLEPDPAQASAASPAPAAPAAQR